MGQRERGSELRQWLPFVLRVAGNQSVTITYKAAKPFFALNADDPSCAFLVDLK